MAARDFDLQPKEVFGQLGLVQRCRLHKEASHQAGYDSRVNRWAVTQISTAMSAAVALDKMTIWLKPGGLGLIHNWLTDGATLQAARAPFQRMVNRNCLRLVLEICD